MFILDVGGCFLFLGLLLLGAVNIPSSLAFCFLSYYGYHNGCKIYEQMMEQEITIEKDATDENWCRRI